MTDSKTDGQTIVRSLSNDYVPGEYWTHYKGGVYQLVSLGVKEDTGEPMIIYKSLKYGTVWVRTLDNWVEMVTLSDGSQVKRFKKGAP